MAKLLLLAPNCDGEDVGEAWVGHQWASGFARRHEVTVLTWYKRGKTPPSRQLENLRVIEWREPPFLSRFERANSLLKPAYVLYYRNARRWIRNALARGERFDLAYQPVPVAMRYPSPVTGLGIPYIIGPVGGSIDPPPAFDQERDSGPWYLRLRNLDRWRMRRDPWLSRTYDQASCVIGIAPYVAEFLKERRIRRFEIMSETGIQSLPELVDRSRKTGVVRLLYVGRLVKTKGLRDAIRALNQLRDLPVVLDVVGEGFDRVPCETLARELSVADRVVFHGWQSKPAVQEFYRQADIFVFPSYREPGGNVAFEAMANGLPLVVCDRGGPGSAVDESCGVRVPATTPDQFASALAEAIRRLIENRDLRLALGAGAHRRVGDTALWERKFDRMDALFADVLRQSRENPARCGDDRVVRRLRTAEP